ncbi:dihydrofolate reductase family protein [Virgibacillus oceani]
MRKVFATTFVTLDGVMESPNEWNPLFWSEEAEKYKREELFATDALLLGRKTYEGFAAAWPTMTDEDGFADRMNSLPKYVVSSTLEKLEWNNADLLKRDFMKEVQSLKREPGQDIAIHGSGELVNSLMQHDLIDELHMMIFPIVLGQGERLFESHETSTALKLIETKKLPNGVIVLHYEADRNKNKG